MTDMQGSLCPVLIGRRKELDVLEDVVLDAARGQGATAVVSGEAGVGKSRLVDEVVGRSRQIGFSVALGHCREGIQSLSYAPLLEAFGGLIEEADPSTLKEKLGAFSPEASLLFPSLGPAAVTPTGGQQERLRLFEALVALVRALAGESGLLLVVEDLHWSDLSTAQFLDHFVRRIGNAKVAVVVTYRVEETTVEQLRFSALGWERSRLAKTIGLQPLTPSEVGAMLKAIFDSPRLAADLRDLLAELSGGNPFVVEEILREAIERGDIFRTTEGWEHKEIRDLHIPRSLTDSIDARLRRLAPETLDVVQAAAVLGAEFSTSALAAITGRAESDVRVALSSAIDHQLIQEHERPGRYAFRHALTKETVYADLPGPRREQLHADAFDALKDSSDGSEVERARHLLGAGRFEEAVPVCLSAAAEATKRKGFDEAAELYERVLPHVAEPNERARALCRTGLALAEASTRLPVAISYLREGIGLLDELGKAVEAAQFRLLLTRLLWSTARPEEARREAELAIGVLEPAGPSSELGGLFSFQAAMHIFDFEGGPAEPLATRAIDIARTIGDKRLEAEASIYLGIALGYLGQVDEGIALMDRCADVAEEARIPDVAARAKFNAGETRIRIALRAREALDLAQDLAALPVSATEVMAAVLEARAQFVLGDLVDSYAAYQRGLATAERLGMGTWAEWCRWGLAQIYIEWERFTEALPLLPRIDEAIQRQDVRDHALANMRFHLAVGNLAEALQLAQQLLGEAHWSSRFGFVVSNCVEVFHSADQDALAADFIEKAQKAIGATGDVHLRFAEGQSALATGDLEAAKSALQSAADRFHEAGYRLDEIRSRIFLARTLVSHDASAAAEEVRLIAQLASDCRSALGQRLASELAGELGLEVEEERAVREWKPLHPVDLQKPTERLVTVMFVDVRGYTSLTNQKAPADMVDKIASFRRWARREIERRYGLIERYAGDDVMAIFNVIEMRLEHAQDALESALALRDKARLLGLNVGAGIAVGPAIVGRLEEGADVATLGETSNLAARLCAQAGPGEVLISEEAARRTGNWITSTGQRLKKRDLQLKGFHETVRAYVISDEIAKDQA